MLCNLGRYYAPPELGYQAYGIRSIVHKLVQGLRFFRIYMGCSSLAPRQCPRVAPPADLLEWSRPMVADTRQGYT